MDWPSGRLAATGSMVVRMLRRAFAVAYVPAGLAFIVIVCAGIYAGYLNRTLHAQSMRAEVQTKINLIRAKLEGHISANIQLVRGLAATIETEPDMSQARFSALAGNLFREETQLRNIAGAPDLVAHGRRGRPGLGDRDVVGLRDRIGDLELTGGHLHGRAVGSRSADEDGQEGEETGPHPTSLVGSRRSANRTFV